MSLPLIREWVTKPPFPNWMDYSSALADYANDLVTMSEGKIRAALAVANGEWPI
jgi:hypothetical protein